MTSKVTQDVLKSRSPAARNATGLILATTKGAIHRQVAWMRAADGLEPGAGVVPTLGGEAMRLANAAQIGGPAWVVSTACSSGLVALIEGAMCILDGEANAMIAAGADTTCDNDFVSDGFNALKAISPTTCRPFDDDRDGLTLGTASAACLLMQASQGQPSCILSGWGVSNDAVHMTAPDRDAGGLMRAIAAALQMAKLAPKDIDVILAHGTGTRYNDTMESLAIERVFLSARASPTVTAVKGLLGHTLGASGIIESVLAARMIKTQTVLPIIGLHAPERADIDFVTTARPMRIRHLLKIASGFGGMNAAIILSQPEGAA